MNHELPSLLREMLANGAWATTGNEVDDRIPLRVARRWDSAASGIHLTRPSLLVEDIRHVPELGELWNVTDVDPEECVVIGDFGIGSDNPIVLDFAYAPPTVRTQDFGRRGELGPVWITIATSFDDFVELLGLD